MKICNGVIPRFQPDSEILKKGAKHRPQAGAAGTENNAIGERKVLDSIIKCENICM